ncbi:MAG: ferritin family protein [Deltaproteobacteria bacterium]|nr:MAG: ferritin family protein [Deltaproteobacteria bacterium]
MIYGFNAEEVFQIGIDLEENGKHFYEKAADLVDNPDLKAMPALLAQEEIEHVKIFKELNAQLPEAATKETIWDPDHKMNQYLQMMADMNIFRSGLDVDKQLSGIKTHEDALRLAIQFEKDSIVFYTTMQDATADTKGREFIGQLIYEEKKHLKKLALELKKHTTCKE